MEGTKLRHAEWKSGSSDAHLIFSHGNNLYLRTDFKDPNTDVP
jgi:hypothetical protein